MPLVFRPHESLIRLLQERGVLSRPSAGADPELVEGIADRSELAVRPRRRRGARAEPTEHDRNQR